MSPDLNGGRIIDAEFGDNNFGRGVMRSAGWWADLKARVQELCENAYDRGKKDCLAPNHSIVADDQLDYYQGVEKRIIQIFTEFFPGMEYTDPDQAMSVMQEKLVYNTPEPVNDIIPQVYKDHGCQAAVICKFYKPIGE